MYRFFILQLLWLSLLVYALILLFDQGFQSQSPTKRLFNQYEALNAKQSRFVNQPNLVPKYQALIEKNLAQLCEHILYLPEEELRLEQGPKRTLFLIEPIALNPQYFLNPNIQELMIIADQSLSDQGISLLKDLGLHLKKADPSPPSQFQHAYRVNLEAEESSHSHKQDLKLLAYQALELLNPLPKQSLVLWSFDQSHPLVVKLLLKKQSISLVTDSDLFSTEYYHAINQLLSSTDEPIQALNPLNQRPLEQQYDIVLRLLLDKQANEKIKHCEIKIGTHIQVPPQRQALTFDPMAQGGDKQKIRHLLQNMLSLAVLEANTLIKIALSLLVCILGIVLYLLLIKTGDRNASY